MEVNINATAEWRDMPWEYGDKRGLYLGEILIAYYAYWPTRVHRSEKIYEVMEAQPQRNRHLGNYRTEEECKSVCLMAMENFVKCLEKK